MSQNLIRAINGRTRKSNFKSFLTITSILVSVLLSLYIFQGSAVAKGNALVEGYQSGIDEIGKQNKDLEIDFSRKNSLRDTETLLEDLNFEKVTKIDYIRVLEASVAAK